MRVENTLDDSVTDFEALRRFRGLSVDERMESLFLGTRHSIRETRGVNDRLDTLNGTTARTADALARHLGEHGEQQAGIEFIKRWGARGTGLIVVMLAALGVFGGFYELWEWFMR